ncbi:hypothetical protein PanWU01x14_203040 [Parasponia andersonii]|uniref:Uncharacterized protein n=1 Tax=Parasponia andersonii TaxID=3476 RepID=A0A2P5BWY7_PARAD|nr:hypothetical protein PanWU01x14_203040 [Parasponia andersonii]
MARFEKEKYFPHSSFLEAQVRYGGAAAWQTIALGHKVLRLGIRWKVAIVTSFFVFKNLWLPHPTMFQPITRSNGTNNEMLVSDIITNGLWVMVKLLKIYGVVIIIRF